VTTVTVLPGSGVIFVDAPWSRDDLLIDCGRERDVAMLVKPFFGIATVLIGCAVLC